jgi:hypothetical protein
MFGDFLDLHAALARCNQRDALGFAIHRQYNKTTEARLLMIVRLVDYRCLIGTIFRTSSFIRIGSDKKLVSTLMAFFMLRQNVAFQFKPFGVKVPLTKSARQYLLLKELASIHR